MCHSLWRAAGVVLTLVCSLAHARAKVETLSINNFEVHLIDVQKGKEFGYVFSVPYGSGDDVPEENGLAHHFEHRYSRGSKLFPGHETLINKMLALGFERNAATGLNLTYYYGQGHEDHGLEALEYHLAPLKGMENSDFSLGEEKKTVIDEIVLQAPNRPERALWALPFMVLPKPGHPLRGQLTGTLETLEPMNARSFDGLLERIYHAGNVQLAVVGNFSAGRWSKEQIITKLAEVLPFSRNKPAPFRPAPQPDLVEQDVMLDIANKNSRSGMVMLKIAPEADLRLVRAFLQTFSNSYRNNVDHLANVELGWANGVNGDAMRIGAHHYALLSFSLTEEGYLHRQEFVNWLVASLRAAQTQPYTHDVLEGAKISLHRSYQRMEESVSSIIGTLPEWMASEQDADKLAFNWDAVLARLTPESLMAGARGIQFDHKVAAFLGDDASGTFAHDAFFNVNYKIRPWETSPSLPTSLAPADVQRPHVDVPVAPRSGRTLKRHEVTNVNGWTIVQDHRSEWAERTLALRFSFPALSAVERLSLEALTYAISKDVTPELSALRAQGLRVGFSAGKRSLVFSATGATGNEAGALEWAIARVLNSPYDPKWLARYKSEARMRFARSENGFPGQAVISVAQEVFPSYEHSAPELAQALDQVSRETIAQFLNGRLRIAKKTLAIAGTYKQSEIYHLISVVSPLAPQAGWPEARALQLQGNLDYIEPWLANGTEKTGLGLARLIAAPAPSQVREMASSVLIKNLLQKSIFLKARPLGYVQGAGSLAFGSEDHAYVLYGQVNDPARKSDLLDIWDFQIERWRNGQVTTEEIESARQGAIASLSQPPMTSEEGASNMLSNLTTYGDPFYDQGKLAAVRDVSFAEVTATARKYFAVDQPTLLITKGGSVADCGTLLSSRADLKGRLKP